MQEVDESLIVEIAKDLGIRVATGPTDGGMLTSVGSTWLTEDTDVHQAISSILEQTGAVAVWTALVHKAINEEGRLQHKVVVRLLLPENVGK